MRKPVMKEVLSDKALAKWLELAIEGLPFDRVVKADVVTATFKTLSRKEGWSTRTVKEELQRGEYVPEEFALWVPFLQADGVSTTIRFKLMSPFKAHHDWENFSQVGRLKVGYDDYVVGVKVERKSTTPMNWKGVDVTSDYGDWLGD